MIWHRRVTWCAGIFFLAVAALCNTLDAKPERPVDKVRRRQLLSSTVGNQWHYKVSVGDNSTNAISRVTKMENANKEDLARLEVSVNNSVVAVEHLRHKDDGIYRFRNNGMEITPPICLLKTPVSIKPKEPMKWSGEFISGAEKGKFDAEASEENVEVPAGKYQAIKVVIKVAQGKGATTTYWFVKDIGFVKQTAEAGGLSILMEPENSNAAETVKPRVRYSNPGIGGLHPAGSSYAPFSSNNAEFRLVSPQERFCKLRNISLALKCRGN